MELADIIAEVTQYGTPYITVTGGEPLAQPACLGLMAQLLVLGHIVSLETSGAIDVSEVDPRVVKVMDLKTPSSGELSKNHYQNIQHLTPKDQVKFVIGNDEDYEWSKRAITEHNLKNRCEILFSPVMDQQNPTELAEKILRDRLPVRFQIQLHKLLWDNAQGK
jgi:7-carboxy-7-deazaguanine synthase